MSHDDRTDLRDLMEKAIEAGTRKGLREKAGKWVPYSGPQGGEGWKNTETGDVDYSSDPPGDMDEDAVDNMRDEVTSHLSQYDEGDLKGVYEDAVGESPAEGMQKSDMLGDIMDSMDDHEVAQMAQGMGTSPGVVSDVEEIEDELEGFVPEDVTQGMVEDHWDRLDVPEEPPEEGIETRSDFAEAIAEAAGGSGEASEEVEENVPENEGEPPTGENGSDVSEVADRLAGMSPGEKEQLFEDVGISEENRDEVRVFDVAEEMTDSMSGEEIDEAIESARDTGSAENLTTDDPAAHAVVEDMSLDRISVPSEDVEQAVDEHADDLQAMMEGDITEDEAKSRIADTFAEGEGISSGTSRVAAGNVVRSYQDEAEGESVSAAEQDPAGEVEDANSFQEVHDVMNEAFGADEANELQERVGEEINAQSPDDFGTSEAEEVAKDVAQDIIEGGVSDEDEKMEVSKAFAEAAESGLKSALEDQ